MDQDQQEQQAAAPATFHVEGDLGIIRIDVPGKTMNTITRELSACFEDLFEQVRQKQGELAGVVVCSGKAEGFVVGADIDQIGQIRERSEVLALLEQGHALMASMAALEVAVVAAIDGPCLGGGLEIALACHGRVASDASNTRLGLPEVKLGLIPGMGGTQNLPRLVGIQPALDMILTGREHKARKALKLGLVDEVVHPSVVEAAAGDLARKLTKARKAKAAKGRGAALLGSLREALDNPLDLGLKALSATPARNLLYDKAREGVRAKAGDHYPAPLAAIDAIEYGMAHGLKRGLEREKERFVELLMSDVSRSLIGLFHATQALKKASYVPEGVEAKPVTHVGVLGAGLMGAGIAQSAAFQGYNVRMKDRDAAGVAWGMKYAGDLFAKLAKIRKMTQPEADMAMGRISPTTAYDGLESCEVVIEAVFEDLALKKQILADAEERLHPEAVFASNTSTIPIHKIAEDAKHPERVLGMHFFSPVHKMPLLEIIKTPQTSAVAIQTAVELGRAMGKTVIVVNDGPGFFTSRVIGAYINEAGWILQEGGKIDAIDAAMRSFGFPVGPMTLVDEVGIDVGVKAAAVLGEAFGDRLDQPVTLTKIVDDGRKGRKNKRGLYVYDDGPKRVDTTVYDLLGAPRRDFKAQTIIDRCWLAMLNECAWCLHEGISDTPRDIDIGVIFGLGFPPFRGGILRHADTVGMTEVVRRLNALADEFGERLRPAPRLVEMEREGRRFYPG